MNQMMINRILHKEIMKMIKNKMNNKLKDLKITKDHSQIVKIKVQLEMKNKVTMKGLMILYKGV